VVKIHYASLSQTISENEFQKLSILLPYWGLTINNENKITRLDTPSDITIDGVSERAVVELNQVLAHTGIKDRRAAHPEFIITYKNDDSTPLSIRIQSVTYRFRPLQPLQTQRLQEHIFKNLWLPKRVQPVSVFIDPKHSMNTTEWMSYLLIQYVGSPSDFSHLSTITLKDYQYFVSKYLMKINSVFASFQQLDQSDMKQWPNFPEKPSFLSNLDRSQNKTLHLGEETYEKDSDDLDSSIGEADEIELRIEPDTQLPIQPFRLEKTEKEPEPINPFKIETSSQSVINPFRKKGSKD
jgi:hypothetical protein